MRLPPVEPRQPITLELISCIVHATSESIQRVHVPADLAGQKRGRDREIFVMPPRLGPALRVSGPDVRFIYVHHRRSFSDLTIRRATHSVIHETLQDHVVYIQGR